MNANPRPSRFLKVVHLTSVHPRGDTRIFLKQCRSLAAAGHQVSLIVADGQGDNVRDGVAILDVGRPTGRLERMLHATRRVLARARSLDADIYHLHDPELLPVALVLKRAGKRVIFDAHEDLPRQILSKPYLHPFLRRGVSHAAGFVEQFVAGRLDAVVAATPAIAEKFAAKGVRTVTVNNFPMLGELETGIGGSEKRREVCYVGGITAIRGIVELVRALELSVSGARLNLGGQFSESGTRAAVERLPGWAKVNELGFLSRSQMRDVLARSVAGIVTFLPAPNHTAAQPNKMFEYMSAGLPVIASDFPLWREIVEGNECGICVDPCDPQAIAEAIDRLAGDPELAARMGENGRCAVHERYNWRIEERKLLDLYAALAQKTLGPVPTTA